MIREIRRIDEDFIYHSWLHSVKCPKRGVTDMTRFLIDSVVEAGDILVWCPDDDENHIVGWLAHGSNEQTKLLHYLFVKKNFRRNHVGTELIGSLSSDLPVQLFCTYWSHHMQTMNARSKWNVKFVSNLLASVIHSLHTDKNKKGQETHDCAA